MRADNSLSFPDRARAAGHRTLAAEAGNRSESEKGRRSVGEQQQKTTLAQSSHAGTTKKEGRKLGRHFGRRLVKKKNSELTLHSILSVISDVSE